MAFCVLHSKSAHGILTDGVRGCHQEANVGMLLQEGSSWQVVLRALHAVEAIVQQGSTAACGEVAVHFQVGLLRPSVQHARWPLSYSSPSVGCVPLLRLHHVPSSVFPDETQPYGGDWLGPIAQHIQAVTPCSLHILGINIEKGKLKLSELPGKGFAVGETLRRIESRLPADGPRHSQEGGQLPASLRAAARCRAADAAGR